MTYTCVRVLIVSFISFPYNIMEWFDALRAWALSWITYLLAFVGMKCPFFLETLTTISETAHVLPDTTQTSPLYQPTLAVPEVDTQELPSLSEAPSNI